MIDKTRYWKLVKLDVTGSSRETEVLSAKEFFQQKISSTLDDDREIQKQLLAIAGDELDSPDGMAANLCLRCFISYQIQQVCIGLEKRYGHYYGLNQQDLFAFVLDDDGTALFPIREPPSPHRYQPLAFKILQSFNPGRASLSTWVARLVKSHAGLNAFLLERGLCLLSDWALLNDTGLPKLQRALKQFHQMSDREVTQAQILLESYHAVYRRDRLQQRQKGRCLPPTEPQLQAIGQRMQEQTGQQYTSQALQLQLETLADRLRQYRIASRGGNPWGQSLDQPEAFPLVDDSPTHGLNEPDEQSVFLQFYRRQFLTGLETAFTQVVSERVKTQKTAKAQLFLQALQLFHCQGESMTAIAPVIGLQGQYQVTRLLKLKEFRADVRHCLLQYLKRVITDKATDYTTPEQLNQLDDQIEVALAEQIDAVIQQEQANTKTPKSYVVSSLFARILCHYLDRQLPASVH